MKRHSVTSGVSLIIAIVYVSALMLVMAGLVEARLRVIQSVGNREAEAKASYLAESAFELASYWAAMHLEGQNTADITDTNQRAALFNPLYQAASDLGISNCATSSCAGFDVISRSPSTADQQFNFLNATWYSVPVKGSGTGTSTCIDKNNADDPCNWNKLAVHQSVDIPLYYVDSTGTVHVISGDFKLRVRTPLTQSCTNPTAINQWCAVDRIVLYPKVWFSPDPFRQIDKDSVLIQWTLSDLNGTSTLVAWDRVDQQRNFRTMQNQDQNTEISAGRINDANNYSSSPPFELANFVVLENQYGGKNIDKIWKNLQEFIADLRNNGSSKPVLHLSLVNQPRKIYGTELSNNSLQLNSTQLNDTGRDVSYLEYQVLTQNDPVADNKSSLLGWAEFGGFRKEFRKDLRRSTSLGGFALENF